MNLSLSARSWLTALTLAAPVAQAQPSSAFDMAMDAYAHQHFRDAFDGLAQLADGGHGDAARIALLMVAHGPRLFSQRFDIATARRQQWLDLASAQAARAAG
jgi:hypothetical protein